jgi:hypothetical protein
MRKPLVAKIIGGLISLLLLLPLTTCLTEAAIEPWELGICQSHLSKRDAYGREKALEDIHTIGATWIRFGPSSNSKAGRPFGSRHPKY